MIAQHFLDTWETIPCNNMCDNCGKEKGKGRDVGDAGMAALNILEQAGRREQRVTGNKLVDALQDRGASNLKLSSWNGGGLNKDQAETIVAHLTVEGYIKEDFHFTPYSTISYLVPGYRAVKGELIIRFFGSSSTAKIKSNPQAAAEKINKDTAEKANKQTEKRKLTDDASWLDGSSEKSKTKKKLVKSPEANFDIVISDDDDEFVP